MLIVYFRVREGMHFHEYLWRRSKTDHVVQVRGKSDVRCFFAKNRFLTIQMRLLLLISNTIIYYECNTFVIHYTLTMHVLKRIAHTNLISPFKRQRHTLYVIVPGKYMHVHVRLWFLTRLWFFLYFLKLTIDISRDGYHSNRDITL